MLDNLRREMRIKSTLRALARQRVGTVLQPGNAWVVENILIDTDQTDADLKTCFMRGWVEPLADAIPKSKLKSDGSLPDDLFESSGPVWKLTDSGWMVIHRAHEITLLSIFLAIVGIIVAIGI